MENVSLIDPMKSIEKFEIVLNYKNIYNAYLHLVYFILEE